MSLVLSDALLWVLTMAAQGLLMSAKYYTVHTILPDASRERAVSWLSDFTVGWFVFLRLNCTKSARTRSGCGCGALHWIIGNFELLLVPPQSETLSRYLVKTCKTEIRRVTAPDDAPNRHARARRLWRKEARKEGRGLLSATQNPYDWRHDNLIDKVTNKFDSFIQVLRRNYSWAAHYFVMQTHTHTIRFDSIPTRNDIWISQQIRWQKQSLASPIAPSRFSSDSIIVKPVAE